MIPFLAACAVTAAFFWLWYEIETAPLCDENEQPIADPQSLEVRRIAAYARHWPLPQRTVSVVRV